MANPEQAAAAGRGVRPDKPGRSGEWASAALTELAGTVTLMEARADWYAHVRRLAVAARLYSIGATALLVLAVVNAACLAGFVKLSEPYCLLDEVGLSHNHVDVDVLFYRVDPD